MSEQKNKSPVAFIWIYMAGFTLFGIGHDLNVDSDKTFEAKTMIAALVWPLAIPYVLGYMVAESRHIPTLSPTEE